MNSSERLDLEAALREALEGAAPEPRAGLLDRTMAAIANTPQRRGRRTRPMRWSAGWGRAAAAIVILAGIGAGIVLGDAVAPPASDLPAASVAASADPVVTPGPTTPSAASSETAEPEPPPVAPGTWERVDLPDIAPGAFTGTRANDIAAFRGEYLAVGTFSAYCASDIHETPRGCEVVLSGLQTTLSAAVWVSNDAREWEMLPLQPVFKDASMEHAAADGSVIVVSGVGLEPSARPAIVWVSADGRTWERITGPLLPDRFVSTENGFIGTRAVPIGTRDPDDGPQFVTSHDGRSWRPMTDPGEQGPGEVMGMAVGPDGTTVVAVGVTYEYSDDGAELLGSTATSWVTRDGLSWERSPSDSGHNGARMSAVTATDNGWVAVGVDQTADFEADMAVWTSPDGLSWTRGNNLSAPFGGPDDIAWTGEEIVAAGTVGGDSSSVIAYWLSADGASWERHVPDTTHGAGVPIRIVGVDGAVLVTGVRTTGPDHSIGVVWIGSP